MVIHQEFIIDNINKKNIICKDSNTIIEAIQLFITKLKDSNSLFLCGNGGSASDANHMSTELIKNFSIKNYIKDREIENNLKSMFGNKGSDIYNHLQTGFPAISLASSTSNITAISNDIGFDYSFSQQFSSLSRPNDILICFSTSGSSNNVINAAMLAKAKNNPVVAFTSNSNNELTNIADISIQVQSENVQIIQEQHLKIYHLICEVIEKTIFKEEKNEQLN